MAFQTKVNINLARGVKGDLSRAEPKIALPKITEGVNCVAGNFCYQGTSENQIIGTKTGATSILGFLLRAAYQQNLSGNVSNIYNEGEEATILLNGYVYTTSSNNSVHGNHVLTDPITGDIRCSVNTSLIATAGYLTASNVSSVIADWKAITNGSLTLKINGANVALTGLNFSAITNLTTIATVINTALGSNGTCVVEGTGLKFTAPTTGSNSSVSYVATAGDIGTLLNVSTLGNLVETQGLNAYIDTTWLVNDGDNALSTIEIYK